MGTIPLFVVDRPASLRILEGLSEHKNEFGILAHAFTTNNFKEQFRMFPHTEYKVGDSGIYQGKETSYEELFSEYEKMGVKYGIIKDYYHNPERTLESAKLARRIYKKGLRYNKYSFELLGVAQGNTVAEYLRSYKDQKKLGYETVAIGGLLYKIENHKRMVKVRSNVFLRNVLDGIRVLYPEDRLFPLGIYNRRRMQKLSYLNLWMADYKGWIFRYNKEEANKNGNRFLQVQTYIKNNILNPQLPDGQSPITIKEPQKKRNRLLIMSCSMRKSDESGKAIKVYEGTAFKIIRKYYTKNNHIDVKIISAKYGLLDKNDNIDPYDVKMTYRTSKLYKKVLSPTLSDLTQGYRDIFIYGGKFYKSVMPEDIEYKSSEGKIGQQLSQLNRWLYEGQKQKE